MKRTALYYMLLASIFLFASCERERISFGSESNGTGTETVGEGQVNLASIKVAVEASDEAVTRAAVNTDNFIIRILDSNNSEVRQWTYSNMPEIFSLKAGNYTVTAGSHEEQPAEFSRPFYYGKQDFTIVADEVTQLEVLTCYLQSIMVTVSYSEELYALLGSDVKSAISVEGGGSLDFVKDESRAGYFQAVSPTSNMLKTKLTGSVEGAQVVYEEGFTGIKPGEHRNIHYTLQSINEGGNGEGGSAGITVTIDATCEVVSSTIVVDPGQEGGIEDFPNEGGNGGEDPEPPVPSNEDIQIVGTNFNGTPFDIDKALTIPTDVENCELAVTITAKNGIANLKVTIDSETLTEAILTGVGLGTNFDLAYPGTLDEALQSLGFPTGNNVIGKTEVIFDISQFTPLLGLYGAATHNFIIEVTDQAGSQPVSKTLTIISQD